MVAHFRNEKGFEDFFFRYGMIKTINSPVWGFNFDLSIIQYSILFHPGTKIEWFIRNIILHLTAPCAKATSNAFIDIYSDSPPWALFRRRIRGHQ